MMEGTASPARPKTAQDAGSRHNRYANASETRDDRKGASGPRMNQASPEVISNLIFSLSSISDQSEQLFETLMPVQEKGVRPRSSSKSFKRAQTSHAPSKDALPPLPSLPKDETAASSDKSRTENNKLEPKLDMSFGHLPSVQEVASPSTPKSPASIVASNRSKLGSHPPPVTIPRRSMSLKSAQTTTPGIAESEEVREAFASISITPGKLNNESITSADSAGKKLNGIGRSASRTKSSKDMVKELDAKRKKNRNTRTQRSPGLPKSASSQRSPGFGHSTPNIPTSPGVLGDETPPSPLKAGFLAVPSSPKPSSVRNNLEHVPEQDTAGTGEPLPYAGPSDLSKVRRGPSRGGNVAPGMIPPRGSSSRQSFESTDTRRRAGSGAPSPARSRAESRGKRRPDAGKTPMERNEADTNRRIQELQAAKEERKQREERALAKLQETPLPVLSDIMPNGGVTRLDPNGKSSESRLGKRSMNETRSQSRTKSALSNNGSETRISAQVPRSYSQPVFVPRHREFDAFSMADSIDEEVEVLISDPRLSQTIYHPQTKRCISYSDVGDPDGSVVVCCVGMGCTRYVAALYDEMAQTLGLRLITPERPGISDSEAKSALEVDTPLGWPDDVQLICRHLNITRFSILAHSAGAIYALATALRMPQNIRGRIHILAPWIPPSQLQAIGVNEEPVPVAELPWIQRILRSIPEPLLEAATRIFNMSSITSSLGKSPYSKKRRRNTTGANDRKRGETPALTLRPDDDDDNNNNNNNDHHNNNNEEIQEQIDPRSTASSPMPQIDGMGSPDMTARGSSQAKRTSSTMDVNAARFDEAIAELTEEDREHELEMRHLARLWNLATSNANPAIDLAICLERKQEIGFRYEDITKQVVLHHGTKDTRVSVENVVWIGEKMRRCEVRVLEGEGHGLMASGKVMSDVLIEMAKDWEDWNAVTRQKKGPASAQ